MMHFWLALAAAVTVLAPAPEPQDAPAPRQIRDRTIYVSALDAKGAPVTGLTATDFAVREDGVAREVLKAAPATAPMQIMLLVDDSEAIGPMVTDLREGLHGFVKALAGKAQVGLVTFGERPTSVAPLSSNTAAVDAGIDRIFARPRSGAYLTDAVFDVTRGIEKRQDERPVIVVVTAEGVQYGTFQYERVLDQLKSTGAVMHVLSIGMASAAMDDETRQRNMLIAEGTERTGGRRDQLLSQMALPLKLRQLADELSHQYVLTYARPESLIPPEKIDVTSTKPGITVRARTRVATR